jgi:hippurate hydrolase
VTTIAPDLLGCAETLLPDVVALRRRIHRHPELGLALPRTQAAVLDALADLPLALRRGDALDSVVADLGAGDGPVVLLRADMDALPMTEDTGLEFASDDPGAMHACGHDAHTAMLVGAARLLADRGDLGGTVRFMFQPGEEGRHGARAMIEEGVLTDPEVDVAFALHVSPNLPSGMVGCRPGPLLASADVIDIRVRGRGGHASMPHLAADPMPVAAEIVQALQTLVTRHIDAFDPAVVTITRIVGGTTNNVIPEHVDLTGTVRTVSDSTRARVLAGIERVATNVAAAHDMDARVTVTEGYPPTVNHAQEFHRLADTARAVLGDRAFVELPNPVMGAEDFSYVLARRPGAIAFLGVCPSGSSPATAPACHSNRMTIDEDAMAAGVALYAALALQALDRG